MVIVFMGSPEFAVPSLEAVLAAGHAVACVFTQPDRARSRGRRLVPTPVKEFARSRGIRVLTPDTLKAREALAALRDAAPDVIVVVAYGLLLPPEVLRLPKRGCINLHASLLPRYRGAAPIERAIMAGERVTGVTTMYMAEGWDSGDIILQEEVPVGEDVTAGELRKELAVKGARLLANTLALIESGDAPRTRQNEMAATRAPRMRPEEFQIDWSQPARTIHNLVRAGNPKPGAFTRLNGALLKIYRGRLVDQPADIPTAWPTARPANQSADQRADQCAGGPASEPVSLSVNPAACRGAAVPGTVCGTTPDGFVVRTGDGFYLVLEVQAEGGRRMPAADYLRGHPVEPGTVLGNFSSFNVGTPRESGPGRLTVTP